MWVKIGVNKKSEGRIKGLRKEKINSLEKIRNFLQTKSATTNERTNLWASKMMANLAGITGSYYMEIPNILIS